MNFSANVHDDKKHIGTAREQAGWKGRRDLQLLIFELSLFRFNFFQKGVLLAFRSIQDEITEYSLV